MEKLFNRSKYLRDLIEFRDLVSLSPELISTLHSHHYFCDEMRNVVERLDTDAEKKLFILVHFTRSRSTCDEIVRLLQETGQRDAAQKLKEYNTSKGRIQYFRTTTDLPLNQCKSPLKGSLFYDMMNIPRGTAIIINNVTKEVFLDSNRFKYIFESLHFDVELWDQLTSNEIENRLTEFAQNGDSERSSTDAFILMVISHGFDEQIQGSDGCLSGVEEDVIPIMKIVDIFSNVRCRRLLNKPKMFFFNCCRIKLSEQTSQQTQQIDNNLAKPIAKLPTNPNDSYEKLKTIDEKWARDNQDTYICYACAEGYRSYYDDTGLTMFGQALSHCLAEYSCEETLNQVLSRTCDLLQHYSDQSGNYGPEIRGKVMRKEICFNP